MSRELESAAVDRADKRKLSELVRFTQKANKDTCMKARKHAAQLLAETPGCRGIYTRNSARRVNAMACRERASILCVWSLRHGRLTIYMLMYMLPSWLDPD
jgi:hypothetical protein